MKARDLLLLLLLIIGFVAEGRRGRQQAQPTQTATVTSSSGGRMRCRGDDDIVFLIDESWSVGMVNFDKMKQFLMLLLKSFVIRPSLTSPDRHHQKGGVRIGVCLYSDQPRPMLWLGELDNRDVIREAIQNISYIGGNTATGRAIDFVRETMMTTRRGSRRGASKKLVILTDGESVLDDVTIPAKRLRDLQVEVFAIGIGSDALRSELELICSRPIDKHLMMIDDFDSIANIKKRFIKKLCKRSPSSSSGAENPTPQPKN